MSRDLPPELPISPEDWAHTPAAVQAVVLMLGEEVQMLRAKVARLEAQVALLEERLGQNSQNSSRPPSSDPPQMSRPARKPSGRKPGGQPGHAGAGRPLKPPEEVDAFVDVKPEVCARCGTRLEGRDPHPVRHQVTELPPVQAKVTEYQLHTLCCATCGTSTAATLPQGVPRGAFGPRIQALVSLFTGTYRISKRNVRDLLEDCFGVDLALGSICPLEQATSEAMAPAVEEAKAYVQEQSTANMDETGWREDHHRAWLWTAVTAWVSVFLIRASRGSKVVRELLGQTFSGIVGSDRWSAYSFLPLRRRQLCWGHLKREFQAFVDRGDTSAPLGEALLEQVDQLFEWWYRVRDGTLARSTFKVYISTVRGRVKELLRQGQECAHSQTAATCRELLKVEPALWTFVRQEGVEPTNNAAERALRPGVLWRKSSFGTHSAAGSRFVERMMTAVATLRQQNRNVLEYLTAACEAALRGEAPPSLLPDQHQGTVSAHST
jgi:transposase